MTPGEPNALLKALDYLLDEQVGILRGVDEVPRQPGSADFFRYAAQACSAEPLFRVTNSEEGSGASADRATAMCKAVGEALERYCCAFFVPRQDETPLFSFRAAPFKCTPPDEYANYAPEQYGQPNFSPRPFNADTPVRWIAAHDLTNDETCYVPAGMVFVPYYIVTGEHPICMPISTGLAFHSRYAEAAASGICEVIERDAFTIAWQAKLSMPRIRNASLSPVNRELLARLERCGSRMTLINMTLDNGVPSIMGVLTNDSPELPAMLFAASSHLDPEEAVRKCIEEMALGEMYGRRLISGTPLLKRDPTFKNVVDQHDHINLYMDRANLPMANFVLAAPREIDFGELENASCGDAEADLRILVERVQRSGHRVLTVDVTSDDIRELGFVTVRAIVPGYHPLYFGHHMRVLGGRRLWEVPQKLGYSGVSREAGDNPAPHPFP